MAHTITNGVSFIYRQCIAPRSSGEGAQRRELILNIILFGSVVLVGMLDLSLLKSFARGQIGYGQTIPAVCSTLACLFIFLLFLSRRGYTAIASHLLIALYYASATYCIVRWGVSIPLASLGYALTIIVASLLTSTRLGFVTTGMVSLTLFGFGYSDAGTGFAQGNTLAAMEGPVELSILFFLIMSVSWISKHTVAHQNTDAPDKEKITELHRFAEFGRLSSGIFHDLMNSLNAVIATVSLLEHAPGKLPEVKTRLTRAVHASRRMAKSMSAARKQIQSAGTEELFSLADELHDAADVLSYRAQEAGLVLKIEAPKRITMYADALKFNRVVTTLVANAIDASAERNGENNSVIITLGTEKNIAILRVTDHGTGIPKDVLEKMFDPFFTTKTHAHGMGLGLSTAKDIVETYFGGTIDVQSTEGQGSTFTVTFPLWKKK